MPRLVGKRSNSGVLWSFAVLVVAIAGFGTLEYKGYTDFVPEVGPQVRPTIGGSDRPNLLQPSEDNTAEPTSPSPATNGSAEPTSPQPAGSSAAEPVPPQPAAGNAATPAPSQPAVGGAAAPNSP